MSRIPVPDEQTHYSSRRQDDVDALAWPVFSQHALDLLRSAGEVLHPEPGQHTQRWSVRPLGFVCTIQQRSSGRFVDAHEIAGQDFRLVTRNAQLNDTQLWVAIRVARDTYTLQQLSNGRYIDAHEHSGEDFRLVTRSTQNNDTQRWVIRRVGLPPILIRSRIEELVAAS